MRANNIVVLRESLAPLEPILRSWIVCIEHYIDVWEGNDLPYWYNERGNVSVLAGAAWRAGWLALEEYQMGKHGAEHGELTGGRNDLCLANSQHEFYIEAKVAYLNIAELDRSAFRLAEVTAAAVRDAKRLSCDAQRVAAVFVAPYAAEGQLEDVQIERFVAMLNARRDDLLTCMRPALESLPLSHENRIYPLAALISIET